MFFNAEKIFFYVFDFHQSHLQKTHKNILMLIFTVYDSFIFEVFQIFFINQSNLVTSCTYKFLFVYNYYFIYH